MLCVDGNLHFKITNSSFFVVCAISEPAPEAKGAAADSKAAAPAQAEAAKAGAAGSSVTGAKPSSRVSQAAGGNSTISLGGDDVR